MTSTLVRRCLLWLKKASCRSESSARVEKLDFDVLTFAWVEEL